MATSPATLIAARILMGVGSCCYLMAPLALYARRFPPDRFATLAGIQLGVGTLGTLLATAPLAFVDRGDRLAHDLPRGRGLMLLAGLLVGWSSCEDDRAPTGTARTKRCARASPDLARRCACRRSGALFLMQLASLFELRADRRDFGAGPISRMSTATA